MGGGTSVEIAHIFTHLNVYDGQILTRVSTFVFASLRLPAETELPNLDENAIINAPAGTPVEYPTGKIGIKLEASQSVTRLTLLFEGFRYEATPSSEVKTQLIQTFEATPGGGPAHAEWHGFTVALPPPTDRFQMSALLKIDVKFKKVTGGGPDLYRGIFAVPMIFGYYPVDFADHYALGLTTLQPDRANKVDTSTRLRS